MTVGAQDPLDKYRGDLQEYLFARCLAGHLYLFASIPTWAAHKRPGLLLLSLFRWVLAAPGFDKCGRAYALCTGLLHCGSTVAAISAGAFGSAVLTVASSSLRRKRDKVSRDITSLVSRVVRLPALTCRLPRAPSQAGIPVSIVMLQTDQLYCCAGTHYISSRHCPAAFLSQQFLVAQHDSSWNCLLSNLLLGLSVSLLREIPVLHCCIQAQTYGPQCDLQLTRYCLHLTSQCLHALQFD